MAQGMIRKRTRKGGVSYEVRIPLGKDPLTGRQREWNRSFKTRKEAEAARIAQLAALAQGTAVDPSRLTVAELMRNWLETYARHHVSAWTRVCYERTIRLHIIPVLGAIPVQKLTTDQLDRFYSDKLKAGVGERSVQLCHMRLSQALDQAVRQGLVARNVADYATPPRVVSKEMDTWTVAQCRRFLEVAEQSPYGPVWLVALATGMRRGELLGLRWQDVDFGHRVLHVRQTVGVNGSVDIKPPKSKSSRRAVPIQEPVVVALREHKRRQNERRLARGDAWQDYGIVFCSRVGTPINPNNLKRDFYRLVDRAGVPHIRIHDLRHTHVTLALQQGANLKAVSKRVGHSRGSTTMDLYAHVMPEQHAEVADKVGAALLDVPRMMATSTMLMSTDDRADVH